MLDYTALFTDDGKPADVEESDWLKVPLVTDWNAAGAKLGHRIYPLGPKQRELVDKVFDKLHTQGRMAWSKGKWIGRISRYLPLSISL
ncbi:hypothetical protein BU24DRAFT_174650 [Aaosphaeria arxii CBS 175.79]|uniref:Uncharacterized protein n=1 Tax=Aaosphaeria arxii CBS 175.79 TaxID=1450172 RepID=A0A6A5XSN4_9PLEO|nr:uncharacterized protein BU24DRAFT_174650 [Aaosphaeria arxii CBS 175.79]KAF2015264.1 hypothetical protein BU24DRAFT_174650 [Aaosphaeria arxii CBS 175.79]